MHNLFIRLSLLCIAGWAAPRLSHAEDVVLGCVDCYSSMSLIDQVYRELFPDQAPRWVLIESHPYSADQRHYLSAFPTDRVIDTIRLEPLPDGLSDKAAAERARAMGVCHVFGGMDLGSQRAPSLNRWLGFRDNSVEGTKVRIEKALSAAASGEYAIPTHRLSDVDRAVEWVSRFPNRQIVVKPDVGVLGKDTFYVDTQNETHLRAVLAETLATGKAFVIQPRLFGRKFFANAYTHDGVTKITSASEYFQLDHEAKPNYFLNGFMNLDAPEVQRMQRAVDHLTPAHQIDFGMSHPEFLLDQESGRLFMLEMNGRVAGAGIPEVDKTIYGTSQLHLHLLALFDPDRFSTEFAKFPRARHQSGFMFFVSSPGVGRWNPTTLRGIQSRTTHFLPSPLYAVSPEVPVQKTVSMDTLQGIFYFLGNHADVRRAVEDTLESFAEGRLLDHPEVAESPRAEPSPTCSEQLMHLHLTRDLLTQSMRAAAETVDWTKF